MMLCLPYGLGGYGIEMPLLNCRINVPRELKRIAHKRFYVCDLYWPDAQLAVEYDSDMFHTGTQRISSDSKRRNSLASMDILVITVTRPQIGNWEELKKVARLLAKHTGKRIRCVEAAFSRAHFDLRAQVLAPLS